MHSDTRVGETVGQAFGEGDHPRLGRRVRRPAAGQQAGHAGDVDHGALVGGQHRRQRGVRQLHDRGDVHVELGLQQGQVGGPELPGRTKSRVVHQNPHSGGQPVRHLRAVGFDGQIGDENFHFSAGLVVQFGGQALQPIGVTGDQYQVVAVDGVAAGESSAEPRRRSSDQCDGAWHALEST